MPQLFLSWPDDGVLWIWAPGPSPALRELTVRIRGENVVVETVSETGARTWAALPLAAPPGPHPSGQPICVSGQPLAEATLLPEPPAALPEPEPPAGEPAAKPPIPEPEPEPLAGEPAPEPAPPVSLTETEPPAVQPGPEPPAVQPGPEPPGGEPVPESLPAAAVPEPVPPTAAADPEPPAATPAPELVPPDEEPEIEVLPPCEPAPPPPPPPPPWLCWLPCWLCWLLLIIVVLLSAALIRSRLRELPPGLRIEGHRHIGSPRLTAGPGAPGSRTSAGARPDRGGTDA